VSRHSASDRLDPHLSLPRPRGRVREGAAFGCELVLLAASFLLLPLLVLAPRGTAPLAAVAGLAAAGLLVARRRSPALLGLARPAVPLAFVVAWGAVSAAWAPAPAASLVLALRLCGLLAAGTALAAAARHIAAPARLRRVLLAGFLLALALAAFDYLSGGVLTRPLSTRPYQPAWLNEAANGFAILLLPLASAVAASGRRLRALAVALAAAATVFGLVGAAPKAALAAALATAALLHLAGGRAQHLARAAAVLSALAIVTAPLTFARLEQVPLVPRLAESVKQSAEHRLLIWSFVGHRIAERPLFGWGLDAARAIPGGREPIRRGETWLPLHPHNAPLQLWLELGVPGVVLASLAVAALWLALAAAEWPRGFFAAAGGSLAAASVACLGTYGVWEEWWLGTLVLILFLVRVLARAAAE
jgi:O-antigen ligase